MDLFSLICLAGSAFVSKFADAIGDMVWKYNVIPFDRLLLCLVYFSSLIYLVSVIVFIYNSLRSQSLYVFCLQALRNHEGNEAQVCLFLIQMLLVKPNEFKNRIQEFVRDNSPEHWKHTNWYV